MARRTFSTSWGSRRASSLLNCEESTSPSKDELLKMDEAKLETRDYEMLEAHAKTELQKAKNSLKACRLGEDPGLKVGKREVQAGFRRSIADHIIVCQDVKWKDLTGKLGEYTGKFKGDACLALRKAKSLISS